MDLVAVLFPGQRSLVPDAGDQERAAELAAAHGVEVANDNAPGQIVLSGRRAALDSATAAARAEGLKAMHLDVTGAFHSTDMAPAEQPFLQALAKVDIATPRVPV